MKKITHYHDSLTSEFIIVSESDWKLVWANQNAIVLIVDVGTVNEEVYLLIAEDFREFIEAKIR